MEEQLVVLVDPWQDKYDRLVEANEKLQKLNQTLEEKLLKLAEKHHAETSGLSEQIQDLTQRLVDARLCIHQLADENDRYRNDINVVIQLLQCKPSNFISPKIETLPEDLQRKILGIKNGLGSGGTRKEKKIIKVQVPTFPPTDIMYAVDKGKGKKNGDKDIVSAAIMAKVLQERENERKENRRNNCHCRYRVTLPTTEKSSQTMPSCTISYSEFEFYNSEQDEEEEEDGEDHGDETEMDERLHSTSNGGPRRPQTLLRSQPGRLNGGLVQYPPAIPPRRQNTWQMAGAAGGARLPGGAVPVRTTMTTTFDEIIKTTLEEEARLPTPLFGGHLRQRNLSSNSNHSAISRVNYQHNQQHYDNHQNHNHQSLSSSTSSSAMSPNGSEAYSHVHHHPYPNNVKGFQGPTEYSGRSTNGVPARATPPLANELARSSSSSLSSPSTTQLPVAMSIPTSAAITTDLNGDMLLLMSSSSSSSGNGGSTGGPTSGGASSGGSGSNSNVMSSACNTPSSCSNASTSGIGGSSGSSSSGMFHEPLPLPPILTSQSSSSRAVNTSIGTSSSTTTSTVRKGGRLGLSTSHISNVCANGSVTSVTTITSCSPATGPDGGGPLLTRSTSWSRDKVDSVVVGAHPVTNLGGSSSSIGSSSSGGGGGAGTGGLGLMTSLGNHWRSTVLVHHPPRSHTSYEPLSLISVTGDGVGGQQTIFSSKDGGAAATTSESQHALDSSAPHGGASSSQCHDYSVDCNSDSEQPLLQQQPPQPQQYSSHNHHVQQQYNSGTSYLFNTYHHNPQYKSSAVATSSSSTAGGSGGGSSTSSGGPATNSFFSSVISGSTPAAAAPNNNVGYTATSTTSGNTISSNANQYYRAQKRTFWARSSSTTSTETEI